MESFHLNIVILLFFDIIVLKGNSYCFTDSDTK